MPGSNWPDSQAYRHFALIYIDRNGNLRHEASSSIAHDSEAILSPRVTNAFLRAVAQSAEASQSPFQCQYTPSRSTCWIDPSHSRGAKRTTITNSESSQRARFFAAADQPFSSLPRNTRNTRAPTCIRRPGTSKSADDLASTACARAGCHRKEYTTRENTLE